MLKSGKVTLCWPNYANNASITGGSWAITSGNMLTPYFAEVAKSNSTAETDTKFNLTLERPRASYVIALAAHNLSTTAEWRIRVYDAAGKAVEYYNSGWLQVWPAIYATSELEWEFDNFWSGTITEDDRESFTPLVTHFFPQVFITSYVEVEISDTNNPDNAVIIGRVFLADAWQSDKTASYGISYGYDIGTSFDTAIDEGMTEYADVKTPKRTITFDFATLSEEEGFSRIMRLNRDQGLHKEVLYTETPNEITDTGFSRTFIARQSDVSALSHPYYRNYSTTISLKEIL